MCCPPGDIIKVGQDVNQFQPIEFPEVSQAWFGWVQLIITMMEKLIGLEGIMQAPPRTPREPTAPRRSTPSPRLAEPAWSNVRNVLSGSSPNRRERDWWAQRKYTEAHAISVEDNQGDLTWERAGAPLLPAPFLFDQDRFDAGLERERDRDRVIQEMQLGLRDLTSVWQRLDIEDWQLIKARKLSRAAGHLRLAAAENAAVGTQAAKAAPPPHPHG